MQLEFIEAHNFRNLRGRISFGRSLNIIHGHNGQGKTNWLEAIHLLSRTKSFRTQRLQEAIRFGEDSAFVRGEVSSGSNLKRELQIILQNNTKTIAVNGKRESLTRYLGQFQVFAFTADELEVVRGMPEARRRFIDRGIFSLTPTYAQTVADYNKVIKQKNRILQDASEGEWTIEETSPLLDPWNSQLIQLASRIHEARTDYVARLNSVLEKQLFEQRHISIRYLSSLEGKGDLSNYESTLSDRLQLRLPAEIRSGHALIGPHRDDLEVLLDGREVKTFGSSGQQRSALLLLDLAAISLYNSWHDDSPIFLIDDVDAELDEKRIRRLLEYLSDRSQTFVTTSKRSYLEGFLQGASVFEIEAGELVGSGRETGNEAPALATGA
jgi:DNA replication and repair protein RecF